MATPGVPMAKYGTAEIATPMLARHASSAMDLSVSLLEARGKTFIRTHHCQKNIKRQLPVT